MRPRRRHSLAALATAAALALVLTSCGSGGGNGEVLGADQVGVGANDINPVPRDQLRDGGDLSWPLDAIPDNFNALQIDGALLETTEVITALMPAAFIVQRDASVRVNENYFTSIELTGQNPQQITYTINPEATWTEGTALSWRDLQSQWQALNGTNDAFLAASTTGYEDIKSVEHGRNDQQAVVTFARNFGEWRSLFSPIYPIATTSDPTTFNKGWINQMPTTAGPFTLQTLDSAGQTITLVRNEKWWGQPAKLDRIIYRVTERDALADALANGEIDFYAIGSDVNLFQRARGIPGVEIRQAIEPQYNQITLNGGQGSILADPALRKAVVQGVDRQAIADALIGQIVPNTTPLGNYLYVQGAANYVDHSQGVSYNPVAARAALDKLGWTSQGAVRSKNGQQLVIDLVSTASNPISERISQLTQAQLAGIGVRVNIIPAPAASFFTDYVTPGNFEMVSFAWAGTPFPVTATRNIYTTAGEQNFGHIGSPAIDQLYEQAIRTLDDKRRVELGQQIDQAIWNLMPQLPLYQSTGAYAVRTTLANFGAHGFADVSYENIGYTR
ncbi:MAG TPA: ABC transporter family substrate-binding protein [Pseudonocardiaceae bacterium]|nr:ABC transporter family substrate-binding protein [Pseudonocardiaceae bacterium]